MTDPTSPLHRRPLLLTGAASNLANIVHAIDRARDGLERFGGQGPRIASLGRIEQAARAMLAEVEQLQAELSAEGDVDAVAHVPLVQDVPSAEARAVTDAAVAVAHSASSMLHGLDLDGLGVPREDLEELRGLVRAWTDAGETFIRSLTA